MIPLLEPCPCPYCNKPYKSPKACDAHKGKCNMKPPAKGSTGVLEFDVLRALRIRRTELLEELNAIDRRISEAQEKALQMAKELIGGMK
ncbi:MAG: hypothetical protein KIS29_10500 [Thermoplasmata archaeon]|nr:hypothetical protein [Candidatus Sysuiplasma jiujiangense]